MVNPIEQANNQHRKEDKDEAQMKTYLEQQNDELGEENKYVHMPSEVDNHYADSYNPIEQANRIMGGCMKEFVYISSLNDMRVCGQMEDLKHSDNIILCPSCQASRQKAIDIFKDELEFLENLKKRLIAKDNKEMIEEFSKDKEFWKGVKISFDLFISNLDSRITKLNKALEILK